MAGRARTNNLFFYKKLEKQWAKDKFLCIGLDPDFDKIPKSIKGKPHERIFNFNKAIIDSTNNIVLAYKPNSAFYEAKGIEGMKALTQTIKYIKKNFPEIIIILDAKRADIGNTNNGYVKSAFEELNADAITIHPYLGREAVQPFLDRVDKGIIVLVKTSNPGSSEFQNLSNKKGEPLYQTIAKKISKDWNKNKNVGIVAGATYPKELKQIRKIVRDMPILIPGIGKQGGDIYETVKAGMNSRNWGMIINSSRDIIFAGTGSDFADLASKKANKINNQINEARRKS